MIYRMDLDGFRVYYPQQVSSWTNYLANDQYGMTISHLGEAYSCTLADPYYYITHRDPWNRTKGRWLYIDDGQNIWSPSYLPTKMALDHYCCHHAPGFTIFEAEKNKLKSRSIHFLPRSGCYEFWLVELINQSQQPIDLRIYFCAEFLLLQRFLIESPALAWHMQSSYDDEKNTILFKNNILGEHSAFCRTLVSPHQWDTSMLSFIGDGDISQPEAVLKRKLAKQTNSGDPYAAIFQHQIIIEPNETRTFGCVMGQSTALPEVIEKYPKIENIVDEFLNVKKDWQKKCQPNQFPSDLFSEQLYNYFSSFFIYQIYQQSLGMVREGNLGVRDVCQDSMALCHFDQEGAKKILLHIISKQMLNGRCLRQFYCHSKHHDQRDFRDQQFWQILAVARYVKVTGDDHILRQEIEFLDGKEFVSSVFDHLLRGVNYSLQYGNHDLIIICDGDWDDALSGLGAKGESVMLAQMAFYALTILRDLVKDYQLSCNFDFETHLLRLETGIMRQWNGEWFTRAITAEGVVLGNYDRIFLLPQAWFTIAGLHEKYPDIAATALKSMIHYLDNEYGLMILNPPYTERNDKIGRITKLLPGFAENGAVYNHAAMFGIYALFKIGMTTEAITYLKKIFPFLKDWRQTKIEPFVLTNFYNSGFSPDKKGQGGQGWLTSTVNWLAMTYFDFIQPQQIKLDF